MTTNNEDFSNFGIAPNILEILKKLNFTEPTPIQRQAILPGIEKKDIVGIAQTGTGKTLAFGIPLIQHALQGAKMALVVVPTRELAIQVCESINAIGTKLGVKTATVIGGEDMYRQVRSLHAHPQIVIGTPGRIIDHLERKNISFTDLVAVVLDEADRMLDMGFAPQIQKIFAAMPEERQTMLFSATMPERIVEITKRYMRLPIRVEIAPSGTMAEKISQELFFVEKSDKMRLLEKILGEYHGSILVFSRTKFGAKKIAASVRALGITSTELHSNRSLSQRKNSLEGFKKGIYRVLIATDIAARGIDVKGIELVLNYDLPQSPEDYVHRIGRTGRMGGVGHAISFATPDQRRDVREIEKLVRSAIPLSRLPNLPPARIVPHTTGSSRRPFHPRNQKTFRRHWGK
jgi:ATP-dependent RNA helicase RhlE